MLQIVYNSFKLNRNNLLKTTDDVITIFCQLKRISVFGKKIVILLLVDIAQ